MFETLVAEPTFGCSVSLLGKQEKKEPKYESVEKEVVCEWWSEKDRRKEMRMIECTKREEDELKQLHQRGKKLLLLNQGK